LLSRALTTKPPVAVELTLTQTEGGLTASYVTRRADAGSVLRVALVERGLVSRVTRGENKGKTLKHGNVVRTFATVPLPASAAGTIPIAIPTVVKRQNASVIVFVQDPKTMRIFGATEKDLSQDPGPRDPPVAPQ
jgi:hypothetical protein